jgi:hypothetical protein
MTSARRYRVLANRLRRDCPLTSLQLRELAALAHSHRNFVLEARALATAGWTEERQ